MSGRTNITEGAAGTARSILFAAPAADPRARRPVDAFLLVVCVVVALLALWTHRAPSDLDVRILDLVSDHLPGWMSAIFAFTFALGGLYSIGLLVAIAIFGRERRAIARDMALAVALAFGFTLALSVIGDGAWPQLLPELTDRIGTPPYPVARLVMSFALISVAGPYLTLPIRLLGQRLLIMMAVSAVVLSYGTFSAVVGGIAIGIGAASIIRLTFGSGVGIPSQERIIAALADSGLHAVEVHFLDDQPIGRTILQAELADGTEALVKTYGRDAADAAFVSRLWRRIWYTDLDRSLSAPGLQQVEHESLMLLECDRREVPAAELLGWGRGIEGDAVIATRWLEAPRLGDMVADDIDDEILDRCWQTLDRWQNANMAHRRIDAGLVVLTDDGPILDDVSEAETTPTSTTLAIDVAQMLVATAVAVGPQRATAAALAAIGPDRLADALPLTQRSAMSSRLNGQAKRAGLDLKALRTEVAEAIDAEPPDLVQLQRVTWGGVAMVVLTLVAVWTLIGSLADIGFDTIIDQFADARWSWVVTAFVLAQLVNVGEYLSLTGLVLRPVPFGPTFIFRYALSFISLAVPSEAGAIAMNIRYMRKLGVPAAAAVAQGPLLTVVSKGFDIVLLLLSIRVVGESITYDDFEAGPALRLALLVVVLFVVGAIIAVAVPGIRRRIVPQLKVAYADVRQSITDPQRLLRLLGGALVGRLLLAMTLSASVSAFGSSVTFTEAVFVNSAVGLLVGLMPVPGGIGIGEAALAAGLTLVGVPESAAFAAAIGYRMVTNYIPPVFGFFATRWLTERDYL